MIDVDVIVNGITNKLDDTQRALLSEEILAMKGALTEQNDLLSKKEETIKKLEGENNELLKVNGRLFQKIGYDKPKEEGTPVEKPVEKVYNIEEVINKKGDLI